MERLMLASGRFASHWQNGVFGLRKNKLKMADRIRAGKVSELRIASELLSAGIDVYFPFVDDRAIDLIARQSTNNQTFYFDIQVKSVKNYNRIIGVSLQETLNKNQILVIHYRNSEKEDEFIYLTPEQVRLHLKPASTWHDLVLNKPQRQQYKNQSLQDLARYINEWGSNL